MDTATDVARPHLEIVKDPVGTAMRDTDRMVTVIATYQLSEQGRKASLLAGGDGRASQKLTTQLPASRLHLITVDTDGVARLKLRPRYQLDAEQRVVRVDKPTTYDVPPSMDDLLREAARNHQLERAYFAARTASRTERREAGRELRQRIAEQFLGDRNQRALAHPVPTLERCYVMAPLGRVRFDVTSDQGPAKQVPAEAHRRFRADLRARAERGHQRHSAELAVHSEKTVAVAEWIATRGTPDQQERHAAGLLPIAEVVEAMTDDAFRVLNHRPIYAHDGAERLQAYLRQFPEYANATVTPFDLTITVDDARTASEAQWEIVRELQQTLPDALVNLRAHQLAWKRHPNTPTLTVFGVRVKYKVGPFTLCREYAAPGDGVA